MIYIHKVNVAKKTGQKSEGNMSRELETDTEGELFCNSFIYSRLNLVDCKPYM